MIQSALRALKILEHVGRSERPLGVTEIATALNLISGTVFRGLDALERAGYIERYQSSSRYVLGPVSNQLHRRLLSRFTIRDVSLPYLDQLAFATGETVSLSVPVGWYALRVAFSLGTNDVTHSLPLGEVRELADSLSGRAILAGFAEERLAAYLAWSPALSADAAAAAALREALGPIRERGYASQAQEFASAYAAAAFPIRRNDRPIGAVAIEGPVLHLGEQGDAPALRKWTDIIHSLEKVVADCPPTIEGPFAHLDPDDIVLATG